MALKLPSWFSDLGVVALIFSAGGFYFTINELNQNYADIDKRITVVEKAISIHHGSDWSDRVNELSKVEDLNRQFEASISDFDDKYKTNLKSIEAIEDWVSSAKAWAEQIDQMEINRIANSFRAKVVYSTVRTGQNNSVRINKAHEKGSGYQIGDRIFIENPVPPNLEVEAFVVGYLNDKVNSDVLLQINEELLGQLGLTTQNGRYELLITNKFTEENWTTLADTSVVKK
ncbi:hypothetical protein A134_10260 [Vibrio crassostreae 9CS106]|uniref:hypothetical protein n=1 Tax=Vibrio TaxID=662 RepID=UPI000315660C|nr:hypothetical protein A134_10260 [Vibrio crassostreae 9CS106]